MIIVLLYGLLMAAGINEDPPYPEKIWHVRNESRLAISGESNVNDFMCDVDSYYAADNLLLYSGLDQEYVFSNNRLVINLMEFDCGRDLITRDFRQILNANKNPEIIIRFISLDRVPREIPRHDTLSGKVEIRIAGISKTVEMIFSINSSGNRVTYLHGGHRFSFSDFDLKPPSKLMGLINVKDELLVTFDLVLEELPLADNYSGQVPRGRD